MSPALFSPLRVGNKVARNRLFVPPMCQYTLENRDGVANYETAQHYGALARGGWGAIIVEATAVAPAGRITPWDLGLWNEQQAQALEPIVADIKAHGALAGIQLSHAGRKASTYRWNQGSGTIPADQGGWQPLAPSELALADHARPQALSEPEIEQIIAAFAEAAKVASEIGFDIIQIHGAHGYLLHEFRSALSNQRSDAWGGSQGARNRMSEQTVQAVHKALEGTDSVLSLRLSATDWLEGGLELSDTVALVRQLPQVDWFDISTGGLAPAPIPVGPGYQVRFAQAVKAALAGTAGNGSSGVASDGAKAANDDATSGASTANSAPVVSAVGLITNPASAEQILVTNQADIVEVGRPALANPRLALAWAKELGTKLDYMPPQYARGF
ncbi:oxidoreductase [Actinomyces graevenitzii]|uniref:oxidoreductase n=1 Tax=Actinomyces graevenitzii TaxID=55565 RepID=UPI000C807C11|nr:oxidoreductase [Actinomyces graevenitzii]PMC91729.1 oxidoreductase [Actinomyces graevenitzii]